MSGPTAARRAPRRRARAAGALVCALGLACADAPHATRAVLISLDTLRPDALGCYGAGAPTSPRLDRLAAEGVVFENAFSPAPWTLPAHASLLSGLYPRRHGAITERHALAAGVETLAERLSARGFDTAAFVSSHFVGERYGFARGFGRFEHVDEREALAVDRAADWLAAVGDGPFFLFVHDYQAHSDYAAPPELTRRFARPYDGPVDGTTLQLLRVRAGALELGARDRAHLLDLYRAQVRALDDSLARLLDDLDRAGLRDDTLVVVTSDHGEEFLEHGGVLHGRTQYDEVLRVPLLLRGPGVPAGRRVAAPASLVDVMPTLLAGLGLPAPADLDGEDLSARWREAAPTGAGRVLFGEADHNNARPDVTRSARLGRFKLITDALDDGRALYDLAEDPGETRDVAARHPEVARALGAALERFEAAGAPGEPLPPLEPEVSRQLEALGYLR